VSEANPAFEEADVDVTEARATQPAIGSVDGWSVPALVVGLALVATAVSGLLNEISATEHPLWIVPVAGAFAGCLMVIARSARGLLATPS